jgi:hypothetical protein
MSLAGNPPPGHLQVGGEHTVPDGKGEAMAKGLTAGSRHWRACIALAVLVAGVLALAGCSRETPETRLRTQLAHMQAALEAGDARAFMAGVDEDFVGTGGIDRAALQQGVRAQVLANRRIGVTLGPVDVRLHGAQATTTFSALTTGGSGGWIPERAQAWEVTAGWREDGSQWRLYRLDWQRR